MFDTWHQYNIESSPKTGKHSRIPVNAVSITQVFATTKATH
jgi:hypothetical protein